MPQTSAFHWENIINLDDLALPSTLFVCLFELMLCSMNVTIPVKKTEKRTSENTPLMESAEPSKMNTNINY